MATSIEAIKERYAQMSQERLQMVEIELLRQAVRIHAEENRLCEQLGQLSQQREEMRDQSFDLQRELEILRNFLLLRVEEQMRNS